MTEWRKRSSKSSKASMRKKNKRTRRRGKRGSEKEIRQKGREREISGQVETIIEVSERKYRRGKSTRARRRRKKNEKKTTKRNGECASSG